MDHNRLNHQTRIDLLSPLSLHQTLTVQLLAPGRVLPLILALGPAMVGRVARIMGRRAKICTALIQIHAMLSRVFVEKGLERPVMPLLPKDMERVLRADRFHH